MDLSKLSNADKAKLVKGLTGLVDMKKNTPSVYYEPHVNGQLQFHEADHRYRFMFPGNRFGKTTAMGVEVDLVLQGSTRFGKLRDVPAQVLWFAPQLRQFEVLKKQLDSECLTQGYAFDANDFRFTWPNGSQLWIVPHDRDWKNIQGINPDLICCDEQPPKTLWNELQARGFGKKVTRYVIAATATEGISWMDGMFYKPWVKHHAMQGLDIDAAMKVQSHPTIWLWPKGGIADNPSISDSEKKRFAELDWVGGAKERAVRTGGGFQSWLGDGLFDDAALDRIRERMRELDKITGVGRNGTFAVKELNDAG